MVIIFFQLRCDVALYIQNQISLFPTANGARDGKIVYLDIYSLYPKIAKLHVELIFDN